MEKGEKENCKKNKISPLVLKKNEDTVQIGIDIGGSLSKLAIAINHKDEEGIKFLKSFQVFDEVNISEKIIFFTKFQTPLEKASVLSTTTIFPILKDITSKFKITTIQATGGGALKFKEIAEKQFHLQFVKHDELLSLVNGYLFLNELSPFYEIQNERDIVQVSSSDLEYPHLAVNIGSGVSIVKVGSSDPKDIQRLGGTMMGGGTLIGLGTLLTGLDTYDDLVNLAEKGDHTVVDLTVQDIYGSDRTNDDDAVAASFGKIPEFINEHNINNIKKEDIAIGLLCMICCHITQLANFLAKKTKVNQVIFLGSFTKRHSFAVLCLDKCMKYWSKNIKVRFNHYEGYLGAVGTLVEKNDN